MLLHDRGQTPLKLADGVTAPATAQNMAVCMVANLLDSLTPGPNPPVVPLHAAMHLLQTLRYVAGQSIAAAVLATGPADDGRTVRQIVATDLAGNRYRLTRERGHLPEHVVEPPAAGNDHLHQALRQMVLLTHQVDPDSSPGCPHDIEEPPHRERKPPA
jgi:hypothetical protein